MKKDMMLVINDNMPTEEEMREFEESIPKEEREAFLKEWLPKIAEYKKELQNRNNQIQ